MAAMVRAECRWLRALTSELRSGRLPFPTRAEMLKIAIDLGGPSPQALRDYVKELRTSSRIHTGTSKTTGTGVPIARKKRNPGATPKDSATRKKVRKSARTR